MIGRAVWALALVPLAGCFVVAPCGGSGSCPRADPVREGVYTVASTDRADVVEGDVAVVGDEVFVTYVDDLGNTWEVAYAVTDRYPRRQP